MSAETPLLTNEAILRLQEQCRGFEAEVNRLRVPVGFKLVPIAAAATPIPPLPEPDARLHVSYFRDAPSMRNTEFAECSYFGAGSHSLFAEATVLAYAALCREEDARDAARYRLLRMPFDATERSSFHVWDLIIDCDLEAEAMDAAIDAAIAQSASREESE